MDSNMYLLLNENVIVRLQTSMHAHAIHRTNPHA